MSEQQSNQEPVETAWSEMSQVLAQKLEMLPTPGPDAKTDELARQIAIKAAKEQMGQYFSPHVAQGIEIALGTYTTALTRLEERGES